MKVIFLDVDGVLEPFGSESGYERMDPFCISYLNEILDNVPDICIVVTSAWKCKYVTYKENLEFITKCFELNGIRKEVHDITVDIEVSSWRYKAGRRDLEIMEWLDRHKDVTHWIALDDSRDLGLDNLPVDNVFYTNSMIGLKESDIQPILEKLMR